MAATAVTKQLKVHEKNDKIDQRLYDSETMGSPSFPVVIVVFFRVRINNSVAMFIYPVAGLYPDDIKNESSNG